MKFLWSLICKSVFSILLLMGWSSYGANADLAETYRRLLSIEPKRKEVERSRFPGAQAFAYGCDSYGYFVIEIVASTPDKIEIPAPTYSCKLRLAVRYPNGQWKAVSSETLKNPFDPYSLKSGGAFSPKIFWGQVTVVEGDDSSQAPGLFNSKGEILAVYGIKAAGVGLSKSNPVAYNSEAYWNLALSGPKGRVPFTGLSKINVERQERLVFAHWGQHRIIVKRGCQSVLGRYPKKVFDYDSITRWLTLFLDPLTYSYDNIIINSNHIVRSVDVFPLRFDEYSFKSSEEILYSKGPFFHGARRLSRRERFFGCNVAWKDITAVSELGNDIFVLYRDGKYLARILADGSVEKIDISQAYGLEAANQANVSMAFLNEELYIASYIGGGTSQLVVQKGRVDRRLSVWQRDLAFLIRTEGGNYPEASLRASSGRLYLTVGANLNDEVQVHQFDGQKSSLSPVAVFKNAARPVRMYDAELFPIDDILNYSFRHGPL